MKKTILRYGLYGAITICILFLLAWYLGKGLSYSGQEIIGYASMIISLGFVYFGIKHYRDKKNKGKITFKKAMVIGTLISLITALAFGLIDVAYIELINPDFSTEYYAHMVDEMKNSLSPDEFELKLAEMESQKELFANPLFSFAIMALTVFVIGFIISLISSLILQQNP